MENFFISLKNKEPKDVKLYITAILTITLANSH